MSTWFDPTALLDAQAWALQNEQLTEDAEARATTPVVRIITGSGALTTADQIVLVNSAAGVTLTLPTAASAGADGRSLVYYIKSYGVGAVVLNPDGTETIDGALTLTLERYDAATLASDGTQWVIL